MCHVWSAQQPGLGVSGTLLSITVLCQILEIILKWCNENYQHTTALKGHIILLCFTLISTAHYSQDQVWFFDHQAAIFLTSLFSCEMLNKTPKTFYTGRLPGLRNVFSWLGLQLHSSFCALNWGCHSPTLHLPPVPSLSILSSLVPALVLV